MTATLVLNTDVSPFNAAYQAGRHVARSADSTWFFAFQDGVVGRVIHATPNGLVDIPLSPQPTMRPTLYADPSGLYCCAGIDGDKKHLMIWYIGEYKTVYTSGNSDPRVDALISQVAAMEREIAAINARLDTMGTGGALDPADREALDRLKVWLGVS